MNCYFCDGKLSKQTLMGTRECIPCFYKYDLIVQHNFSFVPDYDVLSSVTIHYKHNNQEYYVILGLEENITIIRTRNYYPGKDDIRFPGLPITPQNIKTKFPLYLSLM